MEFEGGAQGVGEQDAGVVADAGVANAGGGFEQPFFVFLADVGVHFGEGLPEIAQFFRAEYGEAQVGPPLLQGAHGGKGHAGVAEPVGGAHDQLEFFQPLRRHPVRQRDAAPVAVEQKIWVRRFPAVVNPEPVGRLGAYGLFDDEVQARGHLLDSGEFFVALAADGRQDAHGPLAGAAVEEEEGNEEGVTTAGEKGGERGGGGEAAKKRAPNAVVTGVLIHEHSEAAAFADELHGLGKTRGAVEEAIA